MRGKAGIKKKRTGVVVRNAMDKTAVISINRLKKHSTYMKYLKSQKRYLVHDPQNQCQVGDLVEIIETRPLSKRKRWRVAAIIEKSAIRGMEEINSNLLEQVE